MAETDDETKWSRGGGKRGGLLSNFIGKHRRAVEHRRFVLGKGRFGADIVPNGLLHVAIVASPHASAKIISIDTSRGTGS